jgi:Mg-chelatase subunit ChlD
MPLGDGDRRGTSWRVTVTDPRGGRGTDYRVDFKEVDDNGGLLLIPTLIPPAQRDWTQYLGRTARQDRRGQYCAVLCSKDYDKLAQKYGEPLPAKGGLDTVEAILSWGDREVAERIRGSAALYNCGVRMNELCEIIFSKYQHLLENALTRENIVDVCQRFRFLSVKEVDEAFAKVQGFNPGAVPTTAKDLGRPADPPDAINRTGSKQSSEAFGRKGSMLGVDRDAIKDHLAAGGPPQNMVEVPRLVVFCLDWSPSMMSQDTGLSKMTRFQLCIDRVQNILREQVREQDLVSVVAFGANFQTVIAPTRRGNQSHALEAHVGSLKPSMAGGTCFYDAVAHCLQMTRSGDTAPLDSPRWLICLTDGDDLGSRRENANGEVVTRVLDAGINRFNMIMITVGRLKDKNIRIIDGWVERVARSGGYGKHLSDKDAVSIGKAFEVVAEALAADLGGAVEC